MRSFIKQLSGPDREALQGVVSHAGMKVIEQWLANQCIAAPLIAMQEVTHEEVLSLRGKYNALKDVANFIKDARDDLNNPDPGGY